MDEPDDALRAASHRDPYPWYARLRAGPPMVFDARLRLWVTGSAALVGEALADPRLRVRPPSEPVPVLLEGRPAGHVFARLLRTNDGDFHARHRPAVDGAVARWRPEAVQAAARAAAQDLAARVDANTLLSALPVQAMARLLGVAGAALDATIEAVLAFVAGIAPGADGEAIARADTAAAMLMGQGEAHGLDAVRAANRIALMQQSLDATAGLIGNTVLRLRAEPHAGGDYDFCDVDAVVAEVARWDPPVQNTRRFASHALVVGGVNVVAGDGVLLVLAAANRDAALNPEPDRFLAARATRRSFTFGAGVHACPGEQLAIGIAAGALRALAEAGPLARTFGRHAGYRALPNARIPVFAQPQEEPPWSA